MRNMFAPAFIGGIFSASWNPLAALDHTKAITYIWAFHCLFLFCCDDELDINGYSTEHMKTAL